jgi:hypothetical protein
MAPPLLDRVRDTFIAPGRLAAGLGEGPWLDVLLIGTAVAIVSVIAMPDDVFIEQMRDAVTRRGQPVQITSPPEVVARWGRWLAMLGTLATHPAIAFILAGVLTLVFSVLGGGRGSYRAYLALAAHALLIPALGTLLLLLARLVAPDLIGVATLTPTTVSAPGQDRLLTATLARLDPFLIWMMLVLAIGVRSLDGRRSLARASVILLGGYLLTVLASAYLLHPAG